MIYGGFQDLYGTSLPNIKQRMPLAKRRRIGNTCLSKYMLKINRYYEEHQMKWNYIILRNTIHNNPVSICYFLRRTLQLRPSPVTKRVIFHFSSTCSIEAVPTYLQNVLCYIMLKQHLCFSTVCKSNSTVLLVM